jgi:hypothetical protein
MQNGNDKEESWQREVCDAGLETEACRYERGEIWSLVSGTSMNLRTNLISDQIGK